MARDRITYDVGSATSPSDPFGRSLLVIEAGGHAKLDQYTPRGHTAWIGQVAPEELDALWWRLEEAGFPRVPGHDMPGGSALRVLRVGTGGATKSILVAYHAAEKLPGYRQVFWILDTIIRQLSEDTVEVVPPHDSRLVFGVTRQPPAVRRAPTPGAAFAMAYLPARRVAQTARLALLERHAATIELERAIDSARRALAEPGAKLASVAQSAGIALPPAPAPTPVAIDAWLRALSELAVPHFTTPLLQASWKAGESARIVAVSAELAACIAQLRCAGCNGPELQAQAAERADDLESNVATLVAELAETGLPDFARLANDLDRIVRNTALLAPTLQPTTPDGSRLLDELVRQIYGLLDLAALQADRMGAPGA